MKRSEEFLEKWDVFSSQGSPEATSVSVWWRQLMTLDLYLNIWCNLLSKIITRPESYYCQSSGRPRGTWAPRVDYFLSVCMFCGIILTNWNSLLVRWRVERSHGDHSDQSSHHAGFCSWRWAVCSYTSPKQTNDLFS